MQSNSLQRGSQSKNELEEGAYFLTLFGHAVRSGEFEMRAVLHQIKKLIVPHVARVI